MKIFFYLFIILFGRNSFAGSDQFYAKISRMVSKNYQIIVFKGSDIHLLMGNYDNRRLTYKDLLNSSQFYYVKSNANIKGIGKEIIEYNKKGYQVLLRKDKKYYLLEKNQFKKFDPQKNKKSFNVKEENKDSLPAKWYSWRLASSFIQIQESGQYSFEFGWLPRVSLGSSTQLRFAFNLGPYSLENQELEQKISLSTKAELYLRQYWRNYFIELGGGTHYIEEYRDSSTIVSAGVGKSFHKEYWVINERLGIRGLYLQASQISWVDPISEIKFGLELSF
jgi:hypothetical protein